LLCKSAFGQLASDKRFADEETVLRHCLLENKPNVHLFNLGILGGEGRYEAAHPTRKLLR